MAGKKKRWAVGCGEGAGGCSGVGYCSPKCKEAGEAVHRVEHKVFLQARDIANRTKADITLIKLATRIIALQYAFSSPAREMSLTAHAHARSHAHAHVQIAERWQASAL
jgi:hypothetical protein